MWVLRAIKLALTRGKKRKKKKKTEFALNFN